MRPEPRLPDNAGLVQPVTQGEREAVGVFLGWVAEALEWGRENADRAEDARKMCEVGA